LQATGTDLSVRLVNSSQLEVLVAKGHVDIIVPGRWPNVWLSPLVSVSSGELLSLQSNAVYVKDTLSPAALERKIARTDGWIWFAQAPLPQAVTEFNRYHDQQLVLVDPRLTRLEVGGRFRSTDLDSFIATLEHSFDVQATSSVVHGTGAATIYLTGRCLRAQQQCNWPMVQ
jgi:transmembrane sensor